MSMRCQMLHFCGCTCKWSTPLFCLNKLNVGVNKFILNSINIKAKQNALLLFLKNVAAIQFFCGVTIGYKQLAKLRIYNFVKLTLGSKWWRSFALSLTCVSSEITSFNKVST